MSQTKTNRFGLLEALVLIVLFSAFFKMCAPALRPQSQPSGIAPWAVGENILQD
jgi:hypothetical protein